jgi:hypothetical protein
MFLRQECRATKLTPQADRQRRLVRRRNAGFLLIWDRRLYSRFDVGFILKSVDEKPDNDIGGGGDRSSIKQGIIRDCRSSKVIARRRGGCR